MRRKRVAAGAAVVPAAMPRLSAIWPVWGVLVACVWIAFSPVLGNGFVDWDDPKWILENHSFRGLGWEPDPVRLHDVHRRRLPAARLADPESHLRVLRPRPAGLSPGLSAVPRRERGPLASVSASGFWRGACPRSRGVSEARWAGSAPFRWHCTPSIPSGLRRSPGRRPRRTCPASPSRYSRRWPICEPTLSSGVFRRSWMIGSSVLIALAVLTKGSAVVLPFVFLILDAYPLGRLGPGRPSWPAVRKVLIEKAPILVFCLAFTAVAFVAKQLWFDPEVTSSAGARRQSGSGQLRGLVLPREDRLAVRDHGVLSPPRERRFPDAPLRGVLRRASCSPCRRRSGCGGDGPGCWRRWRPTW